MTDNPLASCVCGKAHSVLDISAKVRPAQPAPPPPV